MIRNYSKISSTIARWFSNICHHCWILENSTSLTIAKTQPSCQIALTQTLGAEHLFLVEWKSSQIAVSIASCNEVGEAKARVDTENALAKAKLAEIVVWKGWHIKIKQVAQQRTTSLLLLRMFIKANTVFSLWTLPSHWFVIIALCYFPKCGCSNKLP